MPNLSHLSANHCAIESLPESFLRVRIKIDLKWNRIKTLPRDATITFCEGGGGFGDNLWSSISLDGNPLEYPPRSVFRQGPASVLGYLQETPAPSEAEAVQVEMVVEAEARTAGSNTVPTSGVTGNESVGLSTK